MATYLVGVDLASEKTRTKDAPAFCRQRRSRSTLRERIGPVVKELLAKMATMLRRTLSSIMAAGPGVDGFKGGGEISRAAWLIRGRGAAMKKRNLYIWNSAFRLRDPPKQGAGGEVYGC